MKPTPDLNRLCQALAVARYGSYSMAANRTAVSQSALTRSVQALEEDYGLRIFERGRAGAKLTIEGARFVAAADEFVRQSERVHHRLAHLRTSTVHHVRLGLGAVTSATILPTLLPVLSDADTRVTIRIEPNNVLQSLVRHGEIDFFVGGVARELRRYQAAHDLDVTPILVGGIAVLARHDHPIFTDGATPANLARYPVVAGTFVNETLSPDLLGEVGLRAPVLELDDYHLLAAMLRQTDHLMIGSSLLAARRRDLGLAEVPVTLREDDRPDLALVTPRAAPLSLPARRIADLIVGELLARAPTAVDTF